MGLILSVWRILRCNPYSAGGYDPVPEKGLRYKGPRVPPTLQDHRPGEEGGCCHCHDGEQEISESVADPSIASPEENAEQDSEGFSIHRKDKNQ